MEVENQGLTIFDTVTTFFEINSQFLHRSKAFKSCYNSENKKYRKKILMPGKFCKRQKFRKIEFISKSRLDDPLFLFYQSKAEVILGRYGNGNGSNLILSQENAEFLTWRRRFCAKGKFAFPVWAAISAFFKIKSSYIYRWRDIELYLTSRNKNVEIKSMEAVGVTQNEYFRRKVKMFEFRHFDHENFQKTL